MYNLEELNVKRVKDLLVIAKELGIKGRHDMYKAELVEAIRKAEKLKDWAEKEIKASEEFANSLFEDIKEFDEKSANESEKVQRPKADYISKIEKGVIVAFKINDEKVISGMVDEIKADSFIIKTKNGIRFDVWKNKIIWVKTGARWPRGVYLALRGEKEDECKRPY